MVVDQNRFCYKREQYKSHSFIFYIFIFYIETWEGTASLGTVPYVPCSKVPGTALKTYRYINVHCAVDPAKVIEHCPMKV